MDDCMSWQLLSLWGLAVDIHGSFGVQSGSPIRTNFHEASHAPLSDSITFQLASFPWQMIFLNLETRAYEWTADRDTGPTSRAHIAEGGRLPWPLTSRFERIQHEGFKDYDPAGRRTIVFTTSGCQV